MTIDDLENPAGNFVRKAFSLYESIPILEPVDMYKIDNILEHLECTGYVVIATGVVNEKIACKYVVYNAWQLLREYLVIIKPTIIDLILDLMIEIEITDPDTLAGLPNI